MDPAGWDGKVSDATDTLAVFGWTLIHAEKGSEKIP